MGWKDGKRPEQYLFTITDDFADDWKALKLNAKRDNRNISNVLRDAVTSKIKLPRTKNALVLSPILMTPNWAAEAQSPSWSRKVGQCTSSISAQ